jgi:hypothetical protein
MDQQLGPWRALTSRMQGRRLAGGFAVTILFAVAFSRAQESQNDTPSLEFGSVIQRLEQAQRSANPQTSYQVIRQYQLLGGSSSRVSSTVVAEVDYSPPDRETYVIQEHSGSGRGEEVVRRILDHETALIAGGPASRSGALLTRDNYAFVDLGEGMLQGRTFYLVGLAPKRKEKELIVGRAWVDKNTFLVRRVEGELAKSPSWLLKKVSVRLDFSEVSGVWLQSAMEATADARFVGSQTLQAQTLDCRKADVVANRVAPTNARTTHRGVPAELLFPSRK